MPKRADFGSLSCEVAFFSFKDQETLSHRASRRSCFHLIYRRHLPNKFPAEL
jgi:hypothetical protein